MKGCGRELRVEVEKERVEKEFKGLYSDLERKAKIPGFRPGKAPKNIIKTHFGEDVKKEVLGRLITSSCNEVLKEKNLSSVIAPIISEIELEEEENLKYKVYIEIMPGVTLGLYSGLTIQKEKKEVREKEVEEALAKGRKSFLAKSPIEEEKQREKIRENLELKLALEEMREEKEQLLSQLEENSSFEVPTTLVKRRLSELLSAHLSSIDLKEKSKEEREEIIKGLTERLRPQAYRDIKILFILNEIAKKEKIEVTEDEAEERRRQIAQLSQEKIEEDSEKKEEIREQLRQEKTLEFVRGRAKILWKPEKKVVLAK